MTKKDYAQFAAMLGVYLRDAEYIETPAFKSGFLTATGNIIESVANIFASDNPRFNKESFLKACGIE